MGIKHESSNELKRRICGNREHELALDASSSGLMGPALPIRSEPLAVKHSEAQIDSLPNSVSQKELDDEVTPFIRGVGMKKAEKSNLFPEPTLMRVESSAENILGHMVTKETQQFE